MMVDWPPLREGLDLPADVVTLAVEGLERHPDRPILAFDDGLEVTRAELLDRIEVLAGYLGGRVRAGEHVAIMLENRTEFFVAWIAVNACGAALVSVNTSAGEHDLGHVLRDSGAVMAIVGEEFQELVARCAGPDCREILVVSGAEPDGFAAAIAGGDRLRLRDIAVDPDAVTNVYYTSGTTGPPKGCTVAHDYWIRFLELYLGLYGLDEDDRVLCCLKFFYNDPPWLFLTSLHAGTTLVVQRRFSVSRFWDVVDHHGVTRLFGLAAIPSLLLTAEPSPRDRSHGVEFALHIGIPAQQHAAFVERWGFPWLEGYGLTESGLVIAMPPACADEMTGSGSIGVPCPGVEVRLVDEAGADVETGEPGEILLRAPGLMRGYLNRPEATAEALDRDGWLRTGDLARRDERGFVYFLGRRKDIVRRSGENVAAAEVEEVLRAHPHVVDAAIVPVPDELRGEEVLAHVELGHEGAVEPGELVEFCSERLSAHKVPRYIRFRTEPFPRTPSMRIRKRELSAPEEDPLAGAWDRERQPAGR
jgi:crotonobetaine/carnitine-CoA ligase